MKLAAVILSIWFLLLTFPVYVSAQAEERKLYVGAYGGIVFPGKWQNLEAAGGFSGLQFFDRSLASSVIYGLKAGITPPPKITWIGLEIEVFRASPKAKELISRTSRFGSTEFDVTTLALNWLLRYPGTQVKPYLGVGPSIVWAESGQAGGSASSVGLNLLAGSRLAVGERLFLFAEYKHNRVGLDFSNIKFDYRLHALVGGIGWTF